MNLKRKEEKNEEFFKVRGYRANSFNINNNFSFRERIFIF